MLLVASCIYKTCFSGHQTSGVSFVGISHEEDRVMMTTKERQREKRERETKERTKEKNECESERDRERNPPTSLRGQWYLRQTAHFERDRKVRPQMQTQP
ncbi:hypothetical protein P153DRAFT_48271 [Dothidotthia symphoricarpi CBS 119687]|uniref:Uncharacterized protein n=1 Tax=Dothidotthia symphoricarpi CBS 119687 TaxID=1392245 RepID=A0A6A6ABM8_9PLEO|nr:uncharacterized protein P153DRAFT_48271 [Dothidotthia symphoricarpi CBS 119687]KAF2128111.1 hypothetical protein P153DRAFT_48271 [Dothidotthia symphoricarpi CBS 119687]